MKLGVKSTHNKTLHWRGIPLRSIPASELDRWAGRDPNALKRASEDNACT